MTLPELKTYDLEQFDFAKAKYAKITTKKGVIWVQLYPREAPNTVANFITLVNDGFYDGLTFHRYIPGFMIQGGCPVGDGTGGPGWRIPDEASRRLHVPGALSMAHAGKDTGGSQFFLVLGNADHLNGVHTVFGGIERKDIKSFFVLESLLERDKIEKIEIKEQKD